MSAFICLHGWQKFQHYKDRDPPWVKFYRDMLTAESWVEGTDISRLVQAASILLAARYNNRIPYRWTLLRRVASFDFTEEQFHAAIEHLAATDFLEIQAGEQVASTSLSTCNTTPDGLYSEKSREEQRRGRAEQTQTREECNQVASTSLAVQNATDDETEAIANFSAVKAAYPSGIYPQSDWLYAEREARRRIDEGHTWNELIDGCRRFAAQCAAKGSLGTQFVESPKKFFTLPECKFQELFPLPAKAVVPHKAFTRAPTTAELEAQEATRAAG